MPGFNDRESSATTPGRRTRVYFDLDEQGIIEPGFSLIRRHAEIAPIARNTAFADGDYTTNCRQWKSGAITLRPIQDNLSYVQEVPVDGVDPATYTYKARFDFHPPFDIIDAMSMLCIAALEHPQHVKPALAGITPPPAMLNNNDVFLQKKVEADNPDWSAGGLLVSPDHAPPTISMLTAPDSVLPSTPPPSGGLMSFPQPGTATIPMDPIGISQMEAAADQGFHLRWYLPGSSLDAVDFVTALAFGQYSAYFLGNGQAQVWERTKDSAGADQFRLRQTFRYCRPSEVADNDHHMLIYPHQDPWGNKYISFLGSHLERGEAGGIFSSGRGGGAAIQENLYTASKIVRGTDRDEAPGHVTKAGIVVMYARRDLRVKWSLSLLRFRDSGFVVDQPGAQGLNSSAQVMQLYPSVVIPPRRGTAAPYTVSFQLADAAAPSMELAALIFSHGDTGQKDTLVPITAPSPYVTTYLFGDGNDTPQLWGYRLGREPVTIYNSPGMFSIAPKHGGILGGDLSPQNESAQMNIQDPTNACPRLAIRGEFSAKITTTFLPPADAPPDPDEEESEDPTAGLGLQEITIFRGYALRPHATRHGRRDPEQLALGNIAGQKTGNGGESSVERLYPSPYWREYDILFAGMSRRLQPDQRSTRTANALIKYAEDPDAPPDPSLNGARPPWKVTDAIIDCFLGVGFPSWMVNIADSPIRLYITPQGQADDILLEPNANFLNRAVNLAKNYLGAVPYFDPTAGVEGQWILIYPGTMTTPIFNFFTYCPRPGAIPSHPGAYAYNQGFVSGQEESYPSAPDFNHLIVWTAPPLSNLPAGSARQQVEMSNYLSYKVPGSTIDPDPDNPNYLGFEREYILPAPELAVKDDVAKTQEALELVANRLFTFTCRASKNLPVYAPYYMVQDPDTHQWRPLRLGDRVTYNGHDGWYVRNNNPEFGETDSHQMSRYELYRLLPFAKKAVM